MGSNDVISQKSYHATKMNPAFPIHLTYISQMFVPFQGLLDSRNNLIVYMLGQFSNHEGVLFGWVLAVMH